MLWDSVLWESRKTSAEEQILRYLAVDLRTFFLVSSTLVAYRYHINGHHETVFQLPYFTSQNVFS